MAYHYKLQTLLNVRRNFEEQWQQKLAHEIYVLDNHRKYLRELHNQRVEQVEGLARYRRNKAMQVAMLLFYDEAIEQKGRQIAMQRHTIAAQEKIILSVREGLLEKVKERKIVERLKEKDYLAYTKEEFRKTQNENDEQAVLRFSQKTLI